MELTINKDDLEKALKNKDIDETPKLSKDEEIGFHKGCLNTLAAERAELIKMITNVEAIMQAHLNRLSELGVKLNSGSDNK